MSLASLLDKALPLNRKERFYTGTVFPMITCRDNFRHFDRFTALIPGYNEEPVVADPEQATIEFFTEYSLVESAISSSPSLFADITLAKDTPDIVIFIAGKRRTLISIEAKMYDTPTAKKMAEQLENQ